MHIGNRANYLILELDIDTFRRPRLEVTIAQSDHTKSLVGVEDDGLLDVVTGNHVDVMGFNITAVLRRLVRLGDHHMLHARPGKEFGCASEEQPIASITKSDNDAHRLALA